MSIVVATQNQHKLREMQLIAGTDVVLTHMPDLVMPEETGISFIENALIKAYYVAKHVRQMVISDDSGLIVDALDGKPGVRSSRFAGEKATDEDNIDLLCSSLLEMDIKVSPAKFVCVMVAVNHAEDPLPFITQGVLHGEVRCKKSGQHGFGYDPIFYLPDRQMTLADLSDNEKQTLSHRYMALQSMIKQING